MKNFIIAALLVAGLAFAAPVVHAENIEFFDEMDIGFKLKSDDIILKSDNIDIGAEIGTWDFEQPRDNMFAMGTITIKGWSIFNLSGK